MFLDKVHIASWIFLVILLVISIFSLITSLENSSDLSVIDDLYSHEFMKRVTFANGFYPSVRLATDGERVFPSGKLSTIDGVRLKQGDRVLLKDERDASLNGIYVYTSEKKFERVPDMNHPDQIGDGSRVYVTDGVSNKAQSWILKRVTTGTDKDRVTGAGITFTNMNRSHMNVSVIDHYVSKRASSEANGTLWSPYGGSWYYGASAPTSLMGTQGDYFHHTGSNLMYGPKGSGGWPSEPTRFAYIVSILSGTDAPDPSTGLDGDYYFVMDENGVSLSLYGPRSNGVWPGSPLSLTGPQGDQGEQGPTGVQGIQGVQGAVGERGPTGATGDPGLNGKTVLYGASNPSAGQGENGDFYINTSNHVLFGPKASGTWPSGFSLVGPQGEPGDKGLTGDQGDQGPAGEQGAHGLNANVIIYGMVNPTTEGVNGDFYINTTTHTLFGPKNSVWPAGTSLVGVQGAKGVQGLKGLTGDKGAQGAKGITGTKGLPGLQGVQGNTGPQGTPGVNGRTVLNGTIDPDAEGVDGDFYINTASNRVNGPKSGGLWPAGVSYIGVQGAVGDAGTNNENHGVDGNMIRYGTVDPTTEGDDGDFYINTASNTFFGPRASGAWPSGVSTIGPPGPDGPGMAFGSHGDMQINDDGVLGHTDQIFFRTVEQDLNLTCPVESTNVYRGTTIGSEGSPIFRIFTPHGHSGLYVESGVSTGGLSISNRGTKVLTFNNTAIFAAGVKVNPESIPAVGVEGSIQTYASDSNVLAGDDRFRVLNGELLIKAGYTLRLYDKLWDDTIVYFTPSTPLIEFKDDGIGIYPDDVDGITGVPASISFSFDSTTVQTKVHNNGTSTGLILKQQYLIFGDEPNHVTLDTEEMVGVTVNITSADWTGVSAGKRDAELLCVKNGKWVCVTFVYVPDNANALNSTALAPWTPITINNVVPVSYRPQHEISFAIVINTTTSGIFIVDATVTDDGTIRMRFDRTDLLYQPLSWSYTWIST